MKKISLEKKYITLKKIKNNFSKYETLVEKKSTTSLFNSALNTALHIYLLCEGVYALYETSKTMRSKDKIVKAVIEKMEKEFPIILKIEENKKGFESILKKMVDGVKFQEKKKEKIFKFTPLLETIDLNCKYLNLIVEIYPITQKKMNDRIPQKVIKKIKKKLLERENKKNIEVKMDIIDIVPIKNKKPLFKVSIYLLESISNSKEKREAVAEIVEGLNYILSEYVISLLLSGKNNRRIIAENEEIMKIEREKLAKEKIVEKLKNRKIKLSELTNILGISIEEYVEKERLGLGLLEMFRDSKRKKKRIKEIKIDEKCISSSEKKTKMIESEPLVEKVENKKREIKLIERALKDMERNNENQDEKMREILARKIFDIIVNEGIYGLNIHSDSIDKKLKIGKKRWDVSAIKYLRSVAEMRINRESIQ